MKYIHENTDGSYRISTDEEVEHALELQNERAKLVQLIVASTARWEEISKICKHEVVYDKPGAWHDIRTCVACGYVSLL